MGLFFNMRKEEVAFARQRTLFCLVIYDIKSNKRRLKLAKILEGYGVRVQRSCFEVMLDEKVYKCLISDLNAFYTADEGDSIIVYKGKREETVAFNTYQGATLEDPIIFL